MEDVTEKEIQSQSISCKDCGADLKFKAGTESLTCEYCGTQNAIINKSEPINELDLLEYLEKSADTSTKIVEHFVKCSSCAAVSSIDANTTSSFCPYCSTPLILDQAEDLSIIKPHAMLPFKITSEEAVSNLKEWTKKLWFAPSSLKSEALRFERIKGVYLPFWTYDAQTDVDYHGEKGRYYYETEEYTTEEDGKTVTKTREIRRTSWRPVEGQLRHFFDDVLIPATESLPTKKLKELEPWDLDQMVGYDKQYISGFHTERYQIDLEKGFDYARMDIEDSLDSMIKEEIGGDEQRINGKHVDYSDLTFKHILLPVHVTSYRYKEKVYQILVNARTGEVQGERPYSKIKITALVLACLAIIGAIVYLCTR